MSKKTIDNKNHRQLISALDNFRSATDAAAEFRQLQSKASEEVAAFAATGDLKDMAAIAAILPRQAQVTLLEQRIAAAGEKLEEADQSLIEAVKAMQQELVRTLGQIQIGLVEKAARSMQEHFENLEQARRQALSSAAVKKSDERVLYIQNLGLNAEPPEVAERFLEMAPRLFAEAETLQSELGGISAEGKLSAS